MDERGGVCSRGSRRKPQRNLTSSALLPTSAGASKCKKKLFSEERSRLSDALEGEEERRREKTIRGRLGSHDLADPSLTPDSPTGAFLSNLDSHCLPTQLTERRSGVEQPPLLSGQADGPGLWGSGTTSLTRPGLSAPKETSED